MVSFGVARSEGDPVSVNESPLPDEFVAELIECVGKVEPERTCIFGSSVKEGLDAGDIDILILSEHFEGIQYRARDDLLEWPDGRIFDSWLYTPREFESLCSRGHPFRESIEDDRIELLPYDS
jgi:predicted nucleotidyltransferase